MVASALTPQSLCRPRTSAWPALCVASLLFCLVVFFWVETGGGGYRVSDTYKTDAYGVELATSGVTSNAYRFAGEQFDGDLRKYFSRARYYQEDIGRFLGADTVEAMVGNERTVLHRYLYASNDPVLRIDPSGNVDFTISNVLVTVQVLGVLANSYGLGMALKQGDYKAAAINAVFIGLDLGGYKIISGAFARLGRIGSRALSLSLNAYSDWGKTGVVVRTLYKTRFAGAREALQLMAEEGASMEQMAKRAFELRKSAQIEARAIMSAEDIELQALDELEQWGSREGATYEQFLEKKGGDLQAVIESSLKSNRYVDALFLIFY